MAEKDIVEKTLEGHNDVFADITNVCLFQGKQLVKEEELEDATPRSYYKADGKIREQERDVAKYWRRSKLQIAVLGIENQTSEDEAMPIRVIGYDGAAYRNQIKKSENGPFCPVITIVLSFDYKKRWSKSLHLIDCFDIPEELKPYVNDYQVHLFEIPFMSREQVEMFQSDFKIVADYFVQMRENNDYIPSKETIKHVQEVLEFMAVMNEDTRFEEAYHEEGSGTNMCEYLDRLESRGEKRGITIGEARGEARGITIGEARGEARGKVKGTVATCRRFGLADDQILKEIMEQYHLEEEEALKYLETDTKEEE